MIEFLPWIDRLFTVATLLILLKVWGIMNRWVSGADQKFKSHDQRIRDNAVSTTDAHRRIDIHLEKVR